MQIRTLNYLKNPDEHIFKCPESFFNTEYLQEDLFFYLLAAKMPGRINIF